MVLRSMTGFGRGESTLHGIRAAADISSVNRRQLDIQLTLPRHLNGLDARVAEEIKHFVSRGRLMGEVVVDYSTRLRRESMHIDEDMAGMYIDALRKTALTLGLEDDLRASKLLDLPDVVKFDSAAQNVECVWPPIRSALRKAMKSLLRMRTVEGKVLQKDLDFRILQLKTHLHSIRKLAPGVSKRYRKNLIDRLEKSELLVKCDEERLIREIALFADRCDISEEITRMESHLAQAKQMMRSRSATGKSLDFLAQEMFREMNTIGSKGNDGGIAQHVIHCKGELERFREQVQNIE